MRRWYVPLTVLGLGSIGVVLLSERGRNALREFFARFGQASETLEEWSSDLRHELSSIEATLDRIADSLGPHPEMGR